MKNPYYYLTLLLLPLFLKSYSAQVAQESLIKPVVAAGRIINNALNEKLFEAVYQQDVTKIKKLLSAKEIPDVNAAATGTDLTPLLITTDVLLLEESLGKAPSWNLVQEIAEILLIAGANPNAQEEEGYSPIMNYGVATQPELLNTLLRTGADINLKDNFGLTALSGIVYNHQKRIENDPDSAKFIIERNEPEIALVVKSLLSRHADPNIPDKFGKTFYDYAENMPFVKQEIKKYQEHKQLLQNAYQKTLSKKFAQTSTSSGQEVSGTANDLAPNIQEFITGRPVVEPAQKTKTRESRKRKRDQ